MPRAHGRWTENTGGSGEWKFGGHADSPGIPCPWSDEDSPGRRVRLKPTPLTTRRRVGGDGVQPGPEGSPVHGDTTAEISEGVRWCRCASVELDIGLMFDRSGHERAQLALSKAVAAVSERAEITRIAAISVGGWTGGQIPGAASRFRGVGSADALKLSRTGCDAPNRPQPARGSRHQPHRKFEFIHAAFTVRP